MKPFPAKFPGNCTRCKTEIKIGQQIQGRASSPWVHTNCTLTLTPVCEQRILCWRKAVKKAGFEEEDGNPNVWVRDNVITWWQTNEHFIAQFHVAYDEDEETVVPEFSFCTYDPDAVVTICDALRAHLGVTTSVDEFEEYRAKLMERMQ